MAACELSGKANVLYVMGVSRSGTTLLGEVLGQVPGLAYAGELRWLWDKVGSVGLCGCGNPVTECRVWSSVLAKTSHSRSVRDYALSVSQLGAKAVGRRHTWARVPVMFAASRAGNNSPISIQYGHELVATYRGFLEEVQRDWVVDTSSEPSDGFLLSSLEDVELRVVHLVRDPCGVVYSHQRARPGGSSVLRSAQAAYVAGAWLAANRVAQTLLRRLGPPRAVQVRYEDLMKNPEGTLRSVLELVGVPLPAGLVSDGKVRLEPAHSVAGNPSRFRVGPVPLVEDLSWRSGLTDLDRKLVEVITTPVARRYGYK